MVLNELALLGFSNMHDYMKAGADGDEQSPTSDHTRFRTNSAKK